MKKDNANLDMLRSFAVLVVLMVHILICGFHTDQLGPVNLRQFGRWGVLMFFVHTCLVLMYSLERQSGFGQFLLRRIFRIYPLSIATVLLVVALRIPGGFTNAFVVVPATARNVTLNLLLLQNVRGAESVLAPLWSLPFEMQMYLLLPFIFYLVRSRRFRYVEYLLWTAGLLLACNSWRSEIHGLPSLIFFPCFLSGVVAYRGSHKPSLPSQLWLPAVLAVTLIFAFYPTIESGWLCCLLLGIAIPRFKEVSSQAVRTVVAIVARYSYGIYLLHFICVWLAFDALRMKPAWLQWLTFLATLLLSVYAAYHTIEAPMIRLGSKLAHNAPSNVIPILRKKVA